MTLLSCNGMTLPVVADNNTSHRMSGSFSGGMRRAIAQVSVSLFVCRLGVSAEGHFKSSGTESSKRESFSWFVGNRYAVHV